MQETTTATQTQAYYRHLGGNLYASTVHAQGAWNDHEQHMAPVTGLMVRALEQFQPRADMRLTRFNFDILGLIPAGEFNIETTVLRPGRTIELLQAELVAGGRTAVRVTAWRMLTLDTTAVAALEDEPFPSLEESERWHGLNVWPGGFIASLEGRNIAGHRPGRGRAWLRTPHDMVDGEPTSALVRLMGLVDSANGIAARVPPGQGSYMFPNVDLSVHVYREPTGEWLGLDTKVTFAGDGIGLTSSVLHDEEGPFGRAEQILTVRPIPHAE
ncbi:MULTISPECIES: thioesterase family protein [unclassified Arthrobacter]|uniref:thioesterase family protein n=1 Tax=unclassified Arthrobacter TaxID=235627 RepID=UPI00159D9EBB|nr:MULTISPECIES: thioesterase family protein [unclassified Arthrobacter]MCQ9163847.1 thioesterase family protein [Arthrobacter sp. STN4]NVM99999.1 thioesterase family protein [Arthrobacter sp. SDTb3-6]